ncbi:MAG: FecR domain-containing protein [Bacteroidales bacterium]|nr:FecR domain-containing protein [Bacteroidales bacterium]
MDADEKYYTDLIVKYLSGEITPGEIQVLTGWVESHPDHAREFTRVTKLWHKVQDTIPDAVPDLDQEWQQIASKVDPARVRETNREVVRLRQNEQVKRPAWIAWSLSIAAGLLILVLPAFLFFRNSSSESRTLVAVAEKMTELTLSDGTRVTLNAGSTLSYPAEFQGYLRNVTLKGEAWFEVARDPSKPFTIAAENVRIRAIGTSFFVNTRTPGDCKEIILEKGCVKVFYQPRPERMTVLLPGERAEVATEDYMILKSENRNINYLAWKTRHLVFSNTPLVDVVQVLQSVYRSNIVIAGDTLSDCRISATFDKQSLTSVFRVLSATLDVRITPSGTGYVISGKDCK